MTIVGLDHVQVAAPPGCEDAARRFYRDVLGLVELEKPTLLAARGGVWFGLGAQQLHVGIEAEFVPARKAHPALRVSDRAALESLAGMLAEAGVEVLWAADREIPTMRRFHANDPWGNRLEFVARV